MSNVLTTEERNEIERNILSILKAWIFPNYYGSKIDKSCKNQWEWVDKHAKDLMRICEIVVNYCYDKQLIAGFVSCRNKELAIQYIGEQEILYSYYEDNATRNLLPPFPYPKLSIRLAGNHYFSPSKKYKRELFWIPLVFTYRIESIFKNDTFDKFKKNFYSIPGKFLFLRRDKEMITEKGIIQELQKIIPAWEKRRDLYKEYIKTIK